MSIAVRRSAEPGNYGVGFPNFVGKVEDHQHPSKLVLGRYQLVDYPYQLNFCCCYYQSYCSGVYLVLMVFSLMISIVVIIARVWYYCQGCWYYYVLLLLLLHYC